LPSPIHMGMALEAGARLFGAGPLQLGDLLVREGLVLEPGKPTTLQLVLQPPQDGVAGFRVSSLDASTGSWHLHATGTVARGEVTSGVPEPIADIVRRVQEPVDTERYYGWLGSLGLELGPRFRGVERIVRRDGEVLATMRLPGALAGEAGAHWLHPALFDACFHVIGAALPESERASAGAFLLLGADRMRMHGRPGERFYAHVTNVQAHRHGGGALEAFRVDVRLLDDDGTLQAEFEGVQLKRARPESVSRDPLPAQVRRLLHEVVWREVPRSTGRLPSPPELGGRVGPLVDALAARHGLGAYAEFLPRLDALAANFVVRALRELGFDFLPGTRVTAASLRARLGVLPSHSRLFARMLAMLVEDGLLIAEGEGLRVAAAPQVVDADSACEALRARFPECEAELEVTRAGGRVLSQVLRGECDPLTILFPNGSLSMMERLYQESPPARAYNGLVAEVLRTVGATAPSGRPLRILEIGAGTGGTTAHVLPALEGIAIEYTFTDGSRSHTGARAQAPRARRPAGDAGGDRAAALRRSHRRTAAGMVGLLGCAAPGLRAHAAPSVDRTAGR
ncbi:MAG: hypothetical protein H6Q77_2767, partial [Gemmatimonadetes bacterium]|nr:hypothetical protein [Gemmatimonadota bacterium]